MTNDARKSGGSLASFSNFRSTSADLAAPGTNFVEANISRSLYFLEDFAGDAAGWTQGLGPGCQSTPAWRFYDSRGNTRVTDSVNPSAFTAIDFRASTNAWLMSSAIDLTNAVWAVSGVNYDGAQF